MNHAYYLDQGFCKAGNCNERSGGEAMEIRASFIEERINATRLIEVGVNFREISNSRWATRFSSTSSVSTTTSITDWHSKGLPPSVDNNLDSMRLSSTGCLGRQSMRRIWLLVRLTVCMR